MSLSKKYKYKLSDTDDISNLIELVLEKYNYPRERIVHYTFLIEEALHKWREVFNDDDELEIIQINHLKKLEYKFIIKGKKVNPFDVKVTDIYDMNKMTDNLLAGIGSELRYFYSSINKNNIIVFKFPKEDIENSLFTDNLILLGIPVAIQAIIEAIATNINTFMLGFLDAASMSAVSLVSAFSVIVNIIFIKDGATAMTMIAEHWGTRNRQKINQVITLSLRFAIIFSTLIAIGSFAFADKIMGLYTNVPEIFEKGVQYLRVFCFSYIAYALYKMAYSYMQALGYIQEVACFTIIGCICNISLNALFIFGKFTWLPNSLIGAAVATSLSYVIQVILGFTFLFRKGDFKYNIFNAIDIDRNKFYRLLLLLVGQALSWNIANNIIAATYGHISVDAISANSIIVVVFNIIAGIRGGYTTSSSLLICRYLGKEDFENAKKGMKTVLKLNRSLYIMCLLLFLVAGFSLRFLPLDLSDKAIYYTNFLLVIYGVKMFFTNVNNIINECTLNPGGEAKSVIIIDIIVMWCIMVPISLLIINGIINVDVVIILLLLNIDECCSCPLKYWRYKQYKWLRKIV
ncbi:MAG: MATE family efflux transporter [Erysipelotrichaceae bacterium]|nr:MATE family efflux transporter [Erysipelotrichaceae bacterium]